MASSNDSDYREVLAEILSEEAGFPLSEEFMQAVDRILAKLRERGFQLVGVGDEL